MISHIRKYFPSLTEEQIARFETLMKAYPEWNDKINVISRKDIDNLEVNHILHSLAIARLIQFAPGSKVLDFGAGGGFPSLPLAVLFPDVQFHLVDRVGKKLRVAEDVARQAGLTNVTVQHGDIGECRDKFDFVVSRAVMPLPDLVRLSSKNISGKQVNAMPNGFITLKGGELQGEIAATPGTTELFDIARWFSDEDFFKTKKVTYTFL